MILFKWTNVRLFFSASFSSKEKYYLLLHRQIETETGSSGEQPTRDKFD